MIKTNTRKNQPDFLAVVGKQPPRNHSVDAPVASGVVVVVFFFFANMPLSTTPLFELLFGCCCSRCFKHTFHMQIEIKTAV